MANSSGTFASLGYADFRNLWLGQVFHALAFWNGQIALPLIILQLTGDSATQLGGVIAVRTVPQVFVGMVAGVVSDWFDRRRVLLIVKISVFATEALTATLLLLGMLQLWHIYIYAAVRGVLMAFDQPARQSMIPSIVPPERVVNAMALMSMTVNASRILGAAAAGLVYAGLGAAATFCIMACLSAMTVWFTLQLRVAAHELPQNTGLRAMAAGLFDGLRYAANNADVRSVLGLTAIHFAFGMSFNQVFLPVFAKEVMAIGSAGFGMFSAGTGVGALAMATWIARYEPGRLDRLLPVLVASFGLVAMSFCGATYLPAPLGVVVPGLLVTLIGACQTGFLSLGRTSVLQAAPDTLRGRLLSLFSLGRIFLSAGAAVAGIAVSKLGVQPAQMLFGALSFIAGLGALVRITRSSAAEAG